MPLAKPHRVLIPLAAFLAVLPLLLQGPSCGHDFDFHLLSWLEAATQFAHGGYPHWAFTPAYNAGEPRFLFYPPFSWTLGALLTLILPIQFAGTAFTFVALTLSGFTAHRLAIRYAPPQAALLCATLYLANPYMLFTAYERTAYGELLAAAWLPLLFLAALAPGCPTLAAAPSWAKRFTRPTLRLAVPIALLWLTNAPAAVMGCYALAVLTLTRLFFTRTKPDAPGLDMETSRPRTNLILTTLAGTALGLLLPAFYLFPAAYERRYIQITLATITGMRPQDHFLFHRMPGTTPDDLFHNDVVRTASIVSVILLAAILAFYFSARGKVEAPGFSPASPTERDKRGFSLGALTTLLPLTILLGFLLTPPSLFLWSHTPQLTFLQFPWRLDALLAVIFLIVAALALSRTQPPIWLPPLAALILIVPAYTLFHQPCDSTDTPTARAALFHSPLGTEPTDEYTPSTADNDALHRSAPWWLRCLSTHPDPNDASSQMPESGGAPIHLEWDIPCDALVVLNLRAYPDWLVTVNGHPITPLEPNRQDGLIAFLEPKGHMSLRIRYLRTWDQNLGLLLSALALVIATALLLAGRASLLAWPSKPTGQTGH